MKVKSQWNTEPAAMLVDSRVSMRSPSLCPPDADPVPTSAGIRKLGREGVSQGQNADAGWWCFCHCLFWTCAGIISLLLSLAFSMFPGTHTYVHILYIHTYGQAYLDIYAFYVAA